MCGEFAGGECIGRDIKIVVAFHRFIEESQIISRGPLSPKGSLVF